MIIVRSGSALGLCIAAVLSFLAEPVSAQTNWKSAPRFVEADQGYLERADPARVEFAHQAYEALYRADPRDWEAGWRLSMTCYFMGGRVAKDKAEKEALYAEGRDVALEAVKLNPDCAPCQLLAGINMALYGESVGVVKMIFTLRSIRQHLRKSLELDPSFAEGAAARTLATIDQAVPFFLGGSKKRALRYYKQALEIDPEEPLNYLYYARFLEKRGEYRSALSLVERGLALPQPGPERVESEHAWNLLKGLESKLSEDLKRQTRPIRKVKPGQRKRPR